MKNINQQSIDINERIQFLDILRGFAVFGILAVNIMAFSLADHDFSKIIPTTESAKWYNEWAFWFSEYFAEGKFYTIFSFLFGLGFSVQMKRAEAKGNNLFSFYPRRLLILLGFGILHSFFWWGDVLRLYALLGFVLLACRKLQKAWLLALSVLCFLFSGVVAGFPQIFGDSSNAPTNDIVKSIIFGLIHMGPTVMAMFFLGRLAGELRIFEKLPQYKTWYPKIIFWGVILTIILRLMVAKFTHGQGAAETLLKGLSDITLSAVYISILAMLSLRENTAKYLQPLSYVGRMALTNYIMQTVICVFIFRFFNLEGKIETAMLMLMAVVIFWVQVLYSRWWLARYKYGILEWLWRSLTYGKIQAFRK